MELELCAIDDLNDSTINKEIDLTNNNLHYHHKIKNYMIKFK